MSNKEKKRTVKQITLEREAERFLFRIKRTFMQRLCLQKIFRLPNTSREFLRTLEAVIDRKNCGLRLERLWWSKKYVRVYLYDPFTFDYGIEFIK